MAAKGNNLTQRCRGAEKVRLGEVCLKDIFTIKARIGWQGLTRKEHLVSGDYYLITGTDFVDGKVDFENCKYVAKERFDQDPNIQIRPNDLLITKDGTIGKVALVGSMDKPATLNSGVFVLRRRNDEFDLKYLYYFFFGPKFRKLVDGNLTGCTIAHLNQANLLDFTIQLRTLPAQKRIAAELDKICELKKNAETRLEKLGLLVKSQFVEMFGESLNNEEYRYKLGDLVEIERGGSPRPINEYITDSVDGVNWIKIGDTVPGEVYIRKAKERILSSGITKSRKVEPGDFLLSNSMSFGRPYITMIEGYIHDGWLVLRDSQEKYEKLFLHQLLSSRYVFNQFEKLASGSTVRNLNKDLVAKVEVPLPPLSLQREFAAFVAKVDKLKDVAKKSVEQMDVLYRAKLQEYFG